MIDRPRFQVALERIDPAQWRLFEQLGLVFLSEEYPSLRPVAATSGDGGQDAILFRSDDAPEVTLQFTVRADWARKIEETCTRLKETAPETQVLIYGTSRLKRFAPSDDRIGALLAAWRYETKGSPLGDFAKRERLT